MRLKQINPQKLRKILIDLVFNLNIILMKILIQNILFKLLFKVEMCSLDQVKLQKMT